MPGTDAATTAPAVRVSVVEHRPASTDGYPAHPVLSLDGVTLHMHRADDGAVVVWVDTEDDAQLAALRVNVNDGPVFGYPENDGGIDARSHRHRTVDDGETKHVLGGTRAGRETRLGNVMRTSATTVAQYLDRTDPKDDTVVLFDESTGQEVQVPVGKIPEVIQAMTVTLQGGVDAIAWAGMEIRPDTFANLAYALGVFFCTTAHRGALGPTPAPHTGSAAGPIIRPSS